MPRQFQEARQHLRISLRIELVSMSHSKMVPSSLWKKPLKEVKLEKEEREVKLFEIVEKEFEIKVYQCEHSLNYA